MTFSEAITELVKGNKITREIWDGYVDVATGFSYTDTKGESIPFSLVGLSTTQNFVKIASGEVMLGWTATQSDMLAEDWDLYEETAEEEDSSAANTTSKES